MIEWWTYAPSDFLMFAPRIYWRLFEAQNRQWWPIQLLWSSAALGWLAGWRIDRGATAARVGLAAMAIAWAVVAVDFHARRFAPINWPAETFAAAWGLQAACLSIAALSAGWRRAESRARLLSAGAIAAWALVVYPMLAGLSGRPWAQAEFLGLAPDPTALATLALLLATQAAGAWPRWTRRTALAAAFAWCALSAATLATMQSWQALAVALPAVIAATALRRG